MCDKKGKFHYFWTLLALVWGVCFGLFMSRKPGKELRQEIYKRWDDGEPLVKAKWSVIAREVVGALRSFPEVIEEFFSTNKASEMKDKGLKLVNEGKKYIDDSKKYVDEGKKFLDKEFKVVTNKAKDVAKEVAKDIKKKIS